MAKCVDCGQVLPMQLAIRTCPNDGDWSKWVPNVTLDHDDPIVSLLRNKGRDLLIRYDDGSKVQYKKVEEYG